MNGSITAMSWRWARPVTASAQACSVLAVAGSAGSMRSSILPPSRPAVAIPGALYPVNRSSTSNAAPGSPPRFIEPSTTLSSSAPSSNRSSTMSADPSIPSTPGRPSATRMRSSRSARFAIAIGRSPAASTPRAPWSAAMIISRPDGPSQGRGRGDRSRIERPRFPDDSPLLVKHRPILPSCPARSAAIRRRPVVLTGSPAAASLPEPPSSSRNYVLSY